MGKQVLQVLALRFSELEFQIPQEATENKSAFAGGATTALRLIGGGTPIESSV
ncbi:hypothetical protein ACQ9BO_09240 [Flavobacterium sp. P21]|uniref:hypothetical protein n=1 Tax=Flavobacterium sp. P21 TaxID=3423948 RepID=UPI003D672BC9